MPKLYINKFQDPAGSVSWRIPGFDYSGTAYTNAGLDNTTVVKPVEKVAPKKAPTKKYYYKGTNYSYKDIYNMAKEAGYATVDDFLLGKYPREEFVSDKNIEDLRSIGLSVPAKSPEELLATIRANQYKMYDYDSYKEKEKDAANAVQTIASTAGLTAIAPEIMVPLLTAAGAKETYDLGKSTYNNALTYGWGDPRTWQEGLKTAAVGGMTALGVKPSVLGVDRFVRNKFPIYDLWRTVRETNLPIRELPSRELFRVGDVEVNNPNLLYRLGHNLGIGASLGGRGMYAKGNLWYGIPTEEMLNPQPQMRGKINLTPANHLVPKDDLLVLPANEQELFGVTQKGTPYDIVPKTIDGITSIWNKGGSRRVPKTSEFIKNNSQLYTFKPTYGYEIIRPKEHNAVFPQKNSDPIDLARLGDVAALQQLKTFGLDWGEPGVYRYISKEELDNIMAGKPYMGRFGDGNVDVTGSTTPSTGVSSQYRITYKDNHDLYKPLSESNRVRMKNPLLKDGYIQGGYSLDDILLIEELLPDGTYKNFYKYKF